MLPVFGDLVTWHCPFNGSGSGEVVATDSELELVWASTSGTLIAIGNRPGLGLHADVVVTNWALRLLACLLVIAKAAEREYRENAIDAAFDRADRAVSWMESERDMGAR